MSQKNLFLIITLLFSPIFFSFGVDGRHLNSPPLKFNKLFVFGDSYADTGNEGRSRARSWKEPYGNTFPKKPTGRFSDGRIFIDYIAEFMGIPTPIPHKFRSVALKRQLKCGMNFAFGGTGVFDTELGGPNMTYQIDEFERLIKLGVFTADDLQSSIAMVSLAGNDYSTHLDKYPDEDTLGWLLFISTVIKQLQVNIQRIRKLGVKRIVLNNLAPLGCVPDITFISSYKNCNDSMNMLVNMHNMDLTEMITNITSATEPTTYLQLGINQAFLTILGSNPSKGLSEKFPDPLRPCCEAKAGANCGSVDANGEKMYSVCQDPASSFFWDDVHPTQEAWKTVFAMLQSNITNLFN